MDENKKNLSLFVVWLLLFGSLLVYSYFYWGIFWMIMQVLILSIGFKPPEPFKSKWGIWLGTVLPSVFTWGLAIAGVK